MGTLEIGVDYCIYLLQIENKDRESSTSRSTPSKSTPSKSTASPPAKSTSTKTPTKTKVEAASPPHKTKEVHKSPPKAKTETHTSPPAGEGEKKKGNPNYRSYLTRDGPRSLGAREEPQVMTFAVTFELLNLLTIRCLLTTQFFIDSSLRYFGNYHQQVNSLWCCKWCPRCSWYDLWTSFISAPL